MKRIITMLLCVLLLSVTGAQAAQLEPNTMVCKLNGETVIFYLRWAEVVSCGQYIEVRYTSYNPRGDAQYDLTLAFQADYGPGDYDDNIYVDIRDISKNYACNSVMNGVSQDYNRSTTGAQLYYYSARKPTLFDRREQRAYYERQPIMSNKGALLRISSRDAGWQTYEGVFAARGWCDSFEIKDAYFSFTIGDTHPMIIEAENIQQETPLALPDEAFPGYAEDQPELALP